MDYEKAYKEALKVIESLYNVVKHQSSSDALLTCQTIEKAFPELKESEDERIRKTLLYYYKNTPEKHICSNLANADVIAWLEKQGEQKPTDKVEPKFHEGDWVATEDLRSPLRIVDVSDTEYRIEDIEGSSGVPKIEYLDKHYHLWTIQDAKDGDVLEFGDHGRLVVGIASYVNKTTGKVDVNCLLENNNFKVGIYYNLDTIKPHPATKEQRELLFDKMKDAGYKWDAEKKELKKIEQNCYHDDGLYYAIDILEKTFGKVEGYQSDDGKMEHQTAIETVNALYHKKPAEWSEEDEKELELLEAYITSGEWSEAHVNRAIGIIGSLHPRSRWKPNKEQLEALEYYIRSFVESGTISPYGPKFQNLQSLYFDLKKL